MKIKIIFFLIIAVLFSSCRIIDFGNDEINCSPDSSSDFYNQECVVVSFNCEVDHFSAEQCIKIQNNNQPLFLLYEWQNNSLYAKPETGWVNGRCYNFSVNGSVLKNNGSTFSVDYKCSFVYGEKDNLFTLTNHPSDDNPLLVSDSISFSFNHEVAYVDITKALKLSPSEKLLYSLSSDQKTITVNPESGWKINTVYKWELNNLLSKDNYELSGVKEGLFVIQSDIENPELLNICPVDESSDSPVWFENTDLDGNITQRESIGFIFSKPMDFSTIKSGISFSPNINGYFRQVEDDGTKFLFVPLSDFEIGTKYLITIADSVKDTVGNALYQEMKKEFYTGDSFLKISSLTVGGTGYSDIPQELVAQTQNNDGNETLKVAVTFSNPIDIEARYSVINNISLNLLFPMTSTAPVLLSEKWDNSRTLTIIWGNITKSTSENSTYYDLKINSGKSGVSTGKGIYMEEDICIHIKISS